MSSFHRYREHSNNLNLTEHIYKTGGYFFYIKWSLEGNDVHCQFSSL